MNLYAAYINLEHRSDRREHMEAELKRVGIKAHRVKGMLPDEYDGDRSKVSVMQNRTPGAIGCHYSQALVMQIGFTLGEHTLVMEDDLVFCSDFKDRMKIVDEFLKDRTWDIFWLGGTYHIEPEWHKKGHSPDLQQCTCTLERDWEPTDNPNIVRTYGCWSTYAYIVNVNSIQKVLKRLDDVVHMSMGIDWAMILLQPELKTFAFNPGMVKQKDGRSDIGNGDTIFSGFASLGPHWFSDKM